MGASGGMWTREGLGASRGTGMSEDAGGHSHGLEVRTRVRFRG